MKYFILGLVIFRLIWGFVGPKYARFSSFLAGPKAMLNYIKSMGSQNYVPPIGHNPIGGLFLSLVLILVTIQGISGLFTSDDIVHSGPYYHTISDALQKSLQWLHHQTFSLLWIFIAVHIAMVFWYKYGLKHDLIKPMLHGKKAVTQDQAIAHSQLLKALIVMILVAIFLYWLVEIAPPIQEDDFYY